MSARIEGYASLFGVPDLGGDVVREGAFAASLGRRPGRVRMLWQHDPGVPIGTWDRIEEDRRGLWVAGTLAPGSSRAAEAAALVAAGALDGLSIGFRTVKATTDPRSGLRRIDEIDLWEVSLVTFPLLPGARVRRFPVTATRGEGR